MENKYKKLTTNEINVLWNEIRIEYFDFSELKIYSLEEIQYYSCLTFDMLIFYFISTPELLKYFDTKSDDIRHSFREILKFSTLCKNNSLQINNSTNISSDVYEVFTKELLNMTQYNVVRNSLELAFNGIVDVFFNSTTNHLKFSKPTNEFFYSKVLDKEKPSIGKKEFNKEHSEIKMFKFANSFRNINKFLTEDNFYTYLNDLKSILISLNKMDASTTTFKENYQFSDFSLSEFKMVYFCLEILCMNKFLISYRDKVYENTSYIPTVIWNKNKLIEYIYTLTSIDQLIICNVIEYLKYDYKVHEKQLTIYQPLFEIDNKIIMNNFLISYSILDHKIIKLISLKSDKKSKNDITLGKIAGEKEKEAIMIEDLTTILNKRYKYIKANVSYKKKAEFDMVVFDNNSNTLLLIELKDFFRSDNEFDNFNRNKNLVEFSEKLNIKKDIIEKDKFNFLKENLKITSNNFKIESCIVTKKSIFILSQKKLKSKIVDEYTFINLLEKSNFNLNDFSKKLNKTQINKDIMYGYSYQGVSIEIGKFSIDAWQMAKINK